MQQDQALPEPVSNDLAEIDQPDPPNDNFVQDAAVESTDLLPSEPAHDNPAAPSVEAISARICAVSTHANDHPP